MLASCSSCGSMGNCGESCYRHLPSVRACSGPTFRFLCVTGGSTAPTHGAGRMLETIWCRADARDHLRLRGGKGCRRTQPAKVPEQWRYPDNRPLDLLREYVKLPGSYWAFGQGLADRTPNITVRRDRPYQHVLRWGASCGPLACSNLPRLLLRGGGGSIRPPTPSMVVSALCLMFTLFVGK